MTRFFVRRIAMPLGIALVASRLGAQCRPPANSHEARLLAFYEAPVAFSPGDAPAPLRPGAVRVGAEAIPVPSPSEELRHPSYCYQYTTNNTRLVPLFGRPRVIVGLPGQLALEASYLPPISVGDARATIASLALSRIQRLPFTSGVALTIRAHATTGSIGGPITCPRGSLQLADEAAPCYGTVPSHDTFRPTAYGAEAALGTQTRNGRVAVYGGGGVSVLQPHFRAGFTDALGNVDHTTVDVDLARATAFAGAALRLRDDVSVAAQIYAVPADVTTIRLGATYRLR